MFQSKINALLFAGLVVGTLDILAAILLLAGGNAEGVLRYIARGAFGDAAFSGGYEMILYGLLFHYFIAFSFTSVYFLIYPYISFMKKQRVLSGLLYGLVVWSVMHFIVLPLSYNAPAPFNLASAWKNIVILMLMVGLPVSLIASRYYRRKI